MNPFETNNNNLDDSTDASFERIEQYRNIKITKDDENNVVLTNAQMTLLEDQRQELADLKRQVVFLKVSHLKNLGNYFNFYVRTLIFIIIRELFYKALFSICHKRVNSTTKKG